ncbi:MAG: KH domain-containing protein [Deltaproteobacteria bacterium]|nr:KH domain-containing protein [Deltaproteobacteria bacterium]
MKDLLIQIVQALVDNPEQVSVTEIDRVDKSDMGKIIGKQGRTANAVRHLLNAASGKIRKRYMLEIVE